MDIQYAACFHVACDRVFSYHEDDPDFNSHYARHGPFIEASFRTLNGAKAFWEPRSALRHYSKHYDDQPEFFDEA